jgi:hypothetical protein
MKTCWLLLMANSAAARVELHLAPPLPWLVLHENQMHPVIYSLYKGYNQGTASEACNFDAGYCIKSWMKPNFWAVCYGADEARFNISGTTNSHNLHQWALENPHATRQSPFEHRFCVNVWAGVIRRYLTGPHMQRTYRRVPVHSLPASNISFYSRMSPWMFAQECGSSLTVHVPTSYVKCAIWWTLITLKDGLVEGVQCPGFHAPQI